MDLPEAQGSLRHARESKSGIPEIFLLLESGILEILIEEFGILGFEIRNPRHGIQSLGPSWIPLHGATRRCSHPRFHETGIYWWFYLFGPGSFTGNEDASEEDIYKFRLGKAWGVFSVPQCLSTKIQLYNAWISSAFLYGRSIWKWPRKMRVTIQAFQDGCRRRAGRSVTESEKVGCHS